MVADIVYSWVDKQIAPWRGHRVREISDLGSVITNREAAFGFYIKDNVVGCDYKLTHLVYAQRAQLYHIFFNQISSRYNLPDVAFAIDVADEAADCAIPVFSFQREKGFKTVLLPDIDFLLTDFYVDAKAWGVPGDAAYAQKSISACFVGSTTGGGHITQDKLAAGAVPRVEAARFFRDCPDVRVLLPNIVQCEAAAAATLAAEGWGKGFLTWQEQLAGRFIISIDGNGATCSRVYVALASNSVLLKYASRHELMYFDDLISGRHFLPIEKHEDVIAILDAERLDPGHFAAVAAEGRLFAQRHLSRGALEAYTAALLWAYAEAA